MAGNLAGMFNQINSAIQANPLGGETGRGLLAGASQGAGQVLGASLSSRTGRPADPMSFMTPDAKNLQGTKMLAGLDMTKAADQKQAAAIYQQMGDPVKAAQAAALYKQTAEAEAKAVTTNATEAALLKIVAGDQSLTKEQRDYYNAAIVNGDIKTRTDYIQSKMGYAAGMKPSSLKGGMVRDEKGNVFHTTVTIDPMTAKPKTEYAVVGTGPAEPVGTITPISSTTGMSGADTFADRVKLAGIQSRLKMSEAELDDELRKGRITFQELSDIRKQKEILGMARQQDWNTERDAIVMNYPNVRLAQNDAEKALKMLDTTSTGGITASIEKIKDFLMLGDTANTAELNAAMATYVLENLKKMGANPTEGERAFLIDASANLARGTEANVALFEKTLRRIELNALASEYLLENPTASRDAYVSQYNKFIDEAAGRRVIKFGDMKGGSNDG